MTFPLNFCGTIKVDGCSAPYLGIDFEKLSSGIESRIEKQGGVIKINKPKEGDGMGGLALATFQNLYS